MDTKGFYSTRDDFLIVASLWSKELLSLYPENVMFDFLVRKTSFYLKDNDFRKYLI